VALRLARREVYEAIGGIAASAQRSRAEPERVQVPLYAMATLLTQSHVLLAQLAAVRTLVTRRTDRLDRAASEVALRAAAEQLDQTLAGEAHPTAPPQVDAAGDLRPGATEHQLPPIGLNEPLLPWLERRLRLAGHAAARVSAAIGAVRVGRR
jgi:uncharacterized membrane protein YccC